MRSVRSLRVGDSLTRSADRALAFDADDLDHVWPHRHEGSVTPMQVLRRRSPSDIARDTLVGAGIRGASVARCRRRMGLMCVLTLEAERDP
jgi:hypothetical protein